MERPLVRILVAVANTQMRNLRAEVEKGSILTIIGNGLVDPKAESNSSKCSNAMPKGNPVNIPEPELASGNTSRLKDAREDGEESLSSV